MSIGCEFMGSLAQQRLKVKFLLIFSLVSMSLPGQMDTDDDGMDDNWEEQYGLDSNDPKDAWWDKDDDQVLNLFEFQLGTSPLNPNSPKVVHFAENGTDEQFEEIIGSGYNGMVVLRIPEGNYNLDFKQSTYFGGGPIRDAGEQYSHKIMIQGGWNKDFTEYNPFCYPTIIRSETDFFRISSIGSDTSVVIFDGLEVTEGIVEAGDFRNAVFVFNAFNYKALCRYSFYNCSFYDNEGGIHFRMDLNAGPGDIFIVNSNISKNGINFEVELPNPKSPTDIHIINSTISLPQKYDKGLMEINYNNLDIVDFNIINSIIWDKGHKYSTHIWPNKSIDLEVVHSNFRGNNASEYEVYNNTNGFDVDPEFIDTASAVFQLPDNSPLRDAGIDMGLAFRNEAPDLGVNPFLMRVHSMKLLHPICGDNQGVIEIDVRYPGPIEYSLDNQKFQNSPTFKNLTEGSYVIYVRAKSLCEYLEAPAILSANDVNNFGEIETIYENCDDVIGDIEFLPVNNSMEYEYSIDGINFQTDRIITDVEAGLYQIYIRDEFNCEQMIGYNVIPNLGMSVSTINITHSDCGSLTGSLSLKVENNNGSFAVTLNNEDFGSQTHFPNLALGDYEILVQDQDGCIDGLDIIIESSESFEFVELEISNSTCGLENGIINLATSDDSSNVQYSIDGISFLSSGKFENLPPGTYTVMARNASCHVEETLEVLADEVSEIFIDSIRHTTCGEDNGLVAVSGEDPEGSYTFKFNGNSNDTGLFTHLSGGSYELEMRDSKNCVQSIAVIVLSSEDIIPQLVKEKDAFCDRSDGNIAVIDNVGQASVQFSLDGGIFQNEEILKGLSGGHYEVVIKDQMGCRDTTNINIIQYGVPQLESEVLRNDLCEKGVGSVRFTASGGRGNLVYAIDDDVFSEMDVYNNLSEGSYEVQVMDEVGCKGLSTFRIASTPQIAIIDLLGDTINCGDQFGKIGYEIEGGTGVFEVYAIDSKLNRITDLEEVPADNYVLNVIDEKGCTNTREVVVHHAPCGIYVPNVFAPSKNNGNEIFKVTAERDDIFTIDFFEISDRWGGVVYNISNQMLNADIEWWDGTFRGESVVGGVYVYALKISSKDGYSEILRGSITVVGGGR